MKPHIPPRKTIGIIGGMGPAATVDLYAKIIASTAAASDQEHLRVIIDSNSGIPDRTAAILGQGEDPLPALITTARTLERAGAQVLVIPCNTAHWYYEGIQEAVGVPVLNMIRETAGHIMRKYPVVKRIGLMATTGTLQTGLYDRALGDVGLTVIRPEPDEQNALMRSIYQGVKAGRLAEAEALASGVARGLADRGAQVLVLGCTELPIALRHASLPVPAIDPTQVLARAAVAAAGGALAAEMETSA